MRLGAGDRLAVDRDVAALVDVARRIAHRDAADGHAPGVHEVLGAAARGDAGVSEELPEAHPPYPRTWWISTSCRPRWTTSGSPRFRAGQVWEWAARGAAGYEDMTNVPAALRASLAERVPFSTLSVVEQAESRDGTVKALFHTADGRPVEAVMMRYRDGRRSLCLSSQSGCPLTCTFCATGSMKFGRNLTASEILDQALHFRRIEPVDHVVYMGMGEPMMNIDAVLAACRRLPDVGVSHRHTTVSTVGWVPGIDRLAAEPEPIRLAFSLHAPEDALRSEIMPVNERYPLARGARGVPPLERGQAPPRSSSST